MTETRINRISIWVPLLCSTVAFAIVLANIVAGVPPQPDENASAHLWQVLMVAQMPFVGLFLLTADWRRWHRALTIAVLQFAAIAAAAIPVWLAGY